MGWKAVASVLSRLASVSYLSPQLPQVAVMKISREWATPLTIGAFALMAITGVLMFFHLDGELNKLAHEWLGWLMIFAVVLHVVVNWVAFKRYFTVSTKGRAVMAISAMVIAATFLPLPSNGEGGGSPPFLAIQALVKAPLVQVAPLTGRSADVLLADLKQAGIVLESADQSLDSVLNGDRARIGAAIKVLFAAP